MNIQLSHVHDTPSILAALNCYTNAKFKTMVTLIKKSNNLKKKLCDKKNLFLNIYDVKIILLYYCENGNVVTIDQRKRL